MQDIFQFLEIDDSFTPNMSQKYNTSRLTRNKFWHQFLDKPNPIKSIIKPLLPLQFRQNLKHNAQEKNLFKPTLSPEIRQQLMKEYQEDILQLQELIQQDLSIWLQN